MESFKVPQQIQYSDQIVAGMTVRQVLVLGLFGIPAYIIFSKDIPLPLKIALIAPIMGAGAFFAFHKREGRYMEFWAVNWLTYYLKPRRYTADGLPSGYSIRNLYDSSVVSDVSSQVPIDNIENNLIKTPMGYVMLLKASSINYRLMGEDSKEKLQSIYKSFLNLLGLGFPLQFYIQVRRQTVQEIKNHYNNLLAHQQDPKIIEILTQERDFILGTVEDSSIVSRRFFIAIPFYPSFGTTIDYSSLIKEAFKKKEAITPGIEVAEKHLSNRFDQIKAQLKGMGIEVEQVKGPELFNLLYDFFNPSLAGKGLVEHDLTSYYEHIKEMDLVPFFQPSYINYGPDYCDISGVYQRTVYPLEYPGQVYPGWLQPLIDLDQDMDVSIHISPMDTGSVIKLLNRNMTKLLSTKYYRQKKGKSDDLFLEAKNVDSVYLLEKLIRQETKLFDFSCYATARSHTLEGLDRATDSIKATFESIQVEPAVASYQGDYTTATTLPIVQDRLCSTRNFDTDSLSTAFPLSSSDLASKDGILYGLNRDNKSLVTLNRFSERNGNMVVLGTSGSGKSFHLKNESLRYFLEGVSITVIDPEREYKAICEALGGQYITLSRNPEQTINPFDPYVEAEGIRGIDRQVGDSLVLLRLMVPGLEETTAKLEELLYGAFKKFDVTTLPDIYEEAVKRDMGGLAEGLYPWVHGSLRNVFSRPTSVDLNSPYIVFDISEMDQDLRPVATYVILSWLWRDIFAVRKPRLIYCDEAWSLLNTAGDWFSAAYRRARKYWAGFCITEHQVESLMSTDIMKAILGNSATKILFGQEPSGIRALESAFNLTEQEKNQILGADTGEGLLYTTNSHVGIRVVSAPSHRRFLTTSPEELYGEAYQNV